METTTSDDEEVRNKRIILRHHISGFPKESDFELVSETKKLKVSEGSGAVLVKVLYQSVDPYQYIRSTKIENPYYFHSFTPGSVISSYGVGKVVDSGCPDFKKGELVWGTTGWEEYSLITEPETLFKIEHQDVPISYYLGILVEWYFSQDILFAFLKLFNGMPGLTAYVGFYELCSPKKGDYVFISSAFGAIGQLVGQLAKLRGCYVVGSAGSKAKVDILKNKLGFDEAFNYKEQNWDETLKRYFPEGIDIFFDNVGGKMLDAALLHMRVNGYIVQCGMISQYTLDQPEGKRNLMCVVYKRLHMVGLVVTDHYHLFPKFLDFILPYIREGKIVYVENISEGLESCPSALVQLFNSSNLGKQVIVVARE